MLVLAIDPSGSYFEGKGTTGWCVFNALDDKVIIAGHICASSYDTKEMYWNAHLQLLDKYIDRYNDECIIVMEEYLLYANRAQDQINSKFETPKVIGIMQHHLFTKNIPYVMQLARTVKDRWSNEILHHKGYIKIKGKHYIVPETEDVIDRHCLDSIRHAVHFATFKNKEE